MPEDTHDTIGGWAKRLYFAARARMEDALRPHGLGATQWYVLHQLASEGPTMQREVLRRLGVERATLSAVVVALVGKGLVTQTPDASDQRQKRLDLTPEGARLWDALPDLSAIHQAAFGGMDPEEVATTLRVLRAATERLEALSGKGPDG